MTLDEIVKHYLFEYKGKRYCVQRTVKIKSPVPSRWFDGILYRPEYDGEVDSTQFYVRPYQDFIEKFKPV